MKLPTQVDRISLNLDSVTRYPYPPLGFVPFEENQLGNGDYFGLYWPVGHEDEDPLVAEMQHDGWSMCPAFSSLDAFLRVAGDRLDWVEPPTLEQDPASPIANFLAARGALANNDWDRALDGLGRAVATLREFGDAQWALSRQLLRASRQEEAFEASLLAAISPPCWGGASRQALDWLKRQKSSPGRCASDPFWLERQALTYKFGGSKRNSDYDVLRKIVDAYIESGEGVKATLLLQTYGELMSMETLSFQERYAFTADKHIEEQIQVGRAFGMDRDTRLLDRGINKRN